MRAPVAGWSSLAARRAHNPKVVGSNPTPATTFETAAVASRGLQPPLPQCCERWHERGVPIKIVATHAIENDQHDHPRRSHTRFHDGQYVAGRSWRHTHAKGSREFGCHVLLLRQVKVSNGPLQFLSLSCGCFAVFRQRTGLPSARSSQCSMCSSVICVAQWVVSTAICWMVQNVLSSSGSSVVRL